MDNIWRKEDKSNEEKMELSFAEAGKQPDHFYLGFLLHIFCGFNLLLVLLSIALSSSAVRSILRGFFGIFRFKNTSDAKFGSARTIAPGWDVDVEVKHRIWQAFWDNLKVKLDD